MRKRKPVEPIKIDEASLEVKIKQPPSCYNKKQSFCKEDLCGEWFAKCKERPDDHPR